MSDYLEIYYELHKNEMKKENKAEDYRKRLINEITIDKMVKIMFANFIKMQSVDEVI